MNRFCSAARGLALATGLSSAIVLFPHTSNARADSPPKALSAEEASLVKLNAARKAFNDKNYPVALAGFKEFIAAQGGHHEAPSAWYGQGLCLLKITPVNFVAAADAFSHAAGANDAPDRAQAIYHWGVSLRASGLATLNDAIARPNEAESLRRTAAQKFTEAADHFSAAHDAFVKRQTDAPAAAPAPLPADLESAARALCDSAEMLSRIGKYREAAHACEPFASDPVLTRSTNKALGLYQLGYAQFMLRDYRAAGRALSSLAPFSQDFGPHAKYLMARVHHLNDESPEATALYKAVVDDSETRRKAAEEALKTASDPQKRTELELVAHGPKPEYVSRAVLYRAVLQYEQGQFADAAQALSGLLQQQPNGPLTPEIHLRLGYCNLQLKKWPDAIAALDPIRDNKQFADRAQWWLAKARLGQADPKNENALASTAAEQARAIKAAADRARDMASADPDAAARRIDMLMDLAEAQQIAKDYKAAAATYAEIASAKPASDRAEEASQHRVTALHLAGAFNESDSAADAYIKAYPHGTLLPAVLFRRAENSYMAALAAANGKTPAPRQEQEKLFNESIERYKKLLAAFPEFEQIDLAKQATAICHSRLGHYVEAIDVLKTVPESNRAGELASIPYLVADCEIRSLPPEADDALTAERLIDTASDAAKMLDSFLAAQPKSPQVPDAMLKLGYCRQRIAGQLAKPDDRAKELQKAREIYEKAMQQFQADPAYPAIVFERANVLASQGDLGGAQNEYRRFESDPLKKSPNAPLAMIRLSGILRKTGQAKQAADLMKKTRDEFESALAADPARADWAPMLRYEFALALQEAHLIPEARAIYDELSSQLAGKPLAVNSAWRIAQCRRLDAAEKLTEARNTAARQGVNPSDVTTAYSRADEPVKQLSTAARTLASQLDKQASTSPNAESTIRMNYELAWCYRTLGEFESDTAVREARRVAIEKFMAHWPKDQSSLMANLSAPEISALELPVPAGEQHAVESYQRLIAANGTSPLASQARLELAELLSTRGKADAALDLLAAALENQPPKPLAQRIKTRVAAALLEKNNPAAALTQLQPILAEKDSPAWADAKYLAGEAYIQQQDWPHAFESLTPFRDADPYRNSPIADRAMIRLAYAYERANQWEPSRQAHEALVSRYGQSAWTDHARYGMGWSLQNQRRFDEAVNAYSELVRRSMSEQAARAQLNSGRCRLEQNRPADALNFLLMIPGTYDYPEVQADALYYAGLAQLQTQKPSEAAESFKRFLREFPNSARAAEAKKKLEEIH